MSELKRDFIHFFGTTGNKDIFFKKIRSPGGLYFNVDDTHIVIDPGVNTFYKYMDKYNEKIDGIILSHIHIDHSNDLNIFVELMTDGGETKRGTVLLPKQALDENVLYKYLRDFPQNIDIIEPTTKYNIKNVNIITSIEHEHGIETYGFKIITNKHTIGLVTDTAYFPELLESYNDCEILIMNVPYYIQDKIPPKHLDIPATEEFIKNVKPRKVILTHFNCNILNSNPELIAHKLSEKYNIDVISSYDDMILEL